LSFLKIWAGFHQLFQNVMGGLTFFVIAGYFYSLHRVRSWGWYPCENRQGSIHLPTSLKNMVKPLH